MSAVTVALLVGFVCCALLIRALRSQGDEMDVAGDGERVGSLHGAESGPLDA
ncbi:hypothetical protein NBRGN_016_02270 [Nocardia brasiliensis NBRC 14402]|uniref:hypothetical protein n=1 Tax=Nocardia brasiliensis TaxID=37326 RepID=UPI0002EDA847|nr:hypothetical protein [Nocardia brasiliensis]GAJ79841.1 hypothetical protein NBRGN_016_02270 [Nocardia brasiliensis NBRC 14402]SUB53571.1 Uncharacterised protein [Nocardia brasiliensis]